MAGYMSTSLLESVPECPLERQTDKYVFNLGVTLIIICFVIVILDSALGS